jgi:signal transduction histidine kinase
MESRTKPLLLASFTAVILLTALTGLAALLLLDRLRAEDARLRAMHAASGAQLHQVRTGILLSGTLARDYFLNPDDPSAPALLAHLKRVETETRQALDHYAVPPSGETAAAREAIALPLRAEVSAYWKLLDLMAGMARGRRSSGVDAYFQNQLAQRRDAMLRIAADVETALAGNLRDGEARSASVFTRLRAVLIAAPVLLAALGALLACVTIRRLIGLEVQARALSAQLVRAQEEERRAIARELHDEVGQWLSSLRLDAGHAMTADALPQHVRARLHSIAALAERSVEALRRIALSLRPSMLDDLGLVPALEWQARETERRASMRIEVRAEDASGDLPESHRTCIFRVAQEALHNCARHSGAKRVAVILEKAPNNVSLRIDDDGRGFSAARTKGLGLLGMEERVGQLGGKFRVRSEPGRGATLIAELPL